MAARLRSDVLLIPQGTSWEVRWPIQESDGTPADLTNWSVRAQARKTSKSIEVLHEWTTAANNAVIIDSSVSLIVSPEHSSSWTWVSAVFDIELVHTDGRVIRVTQGVIQVDPEVTK